MAAEPQDPTATALNPPSRAFDGPTVRGTRTPTPAPVQGPPRRTPLFFAGWGVVLFAVSVGLGWVLSRLIWK